MAELIERLEAFEFPDKTPTLMTAPDSSSKLVKWLQYIDQQKEATAKSMHSTPIGTEAHPKLWIQLDSKVPKGYRRVKRTISWYHRRDSSTTRRRHRTVED